MMIGYLTKTYNEAHRHYHTLEHILYMFRKAREWGWDLTENLVHAVWFHDATYATYPGTRNNEVESARDFKRWIYYRCYGEFSDRGDDGSHEDLAKDERDVIIAILDTRKHKARTELSKQLIDLDLAVLAEPWSYVTESGGGIDEYGATVFPYRHEVPGPYQTYVAQVRKEFASVSDEAWAVGRSAWIESMLKRKNIFWTLEGQKLEGKARENLKKEYDTYEPRNRASQT